MPISREVLREVWTPQMRAEASRAMLPHAEAERKCVKVSGNTVSIDRACMRKAVPKGTMSDLWSE